MRLKNFELMTYVLPVHRSGCPSALDVPDDHHVDDRSPHPWGAGALEIDSAAWSIFDHSASPPGENPIAKCAQNL